MNFHASSSLFLSASSIALGAFVYFKGTKKLTNVTYALMTFSIALWCFGQFMGEISADKSAVLYWTRINLAGGILTLVFYSHFVAAFLKRLNVERFYVASIYFFGAFLILLDATPLIVLDVKPRLLFKFYPVPGPAYPLLMLLFCVSAGYGILSLFRSMRSAKGAIRMQTTYLFLSSLIGFAGASTLFLLVYGIKIYPFGYYLVLFYIFLGVYAIVRHRLLDIEIVIRKGLVYSIMAVLLSVLYIVSLYIFGAFFQTLIGYKSIFPTIAVLFIFAAIFNPLRERLQLLVDIVFFKSRYDFQNTIKMIGDNIALTLDLDELLDYVLSAVVATLASSGAAIFLREPSGSFRLLRTFRVKLPQDKTISSIPRAIKQGKALFHDEPLDPQTAREMDEISSHLAVPLAVKGKFVGILCLSNKLSEDAYSDEDERLLLTLASSLSMAIENALLHEEVVNKQRQLFLSEKLASLGTLSAGMAHEIKNPLAIIKGLAQSLPENLNNPEFLSKLSGILPRQMDRINTLVEDLMAFAKPRGIKQEALDLRLLIGDVVRLVKIEGDKRSIYIDTHFSGELPKKMGDKELLTRAFINIMLNGLQSMAKGGRLTVSCNTLSEERIVVEIADQGEGIPAENLPRIFDPFFTTKEKGSGLGLAVTYGIIKDHGGSIDVESELGSGTKFRIIL